MFKRILSVFFVLVGLVFTACDGNEASSVVVPEPDASIDETLFTVTLMTLSGDASTIKIPVEIFGSTDPAILSGATVDVYINGVERVTGLLVDQLYHELSSEVIFILSPLADGDAVGLLVTQADGGQLYYHGTVLAASDSVASISVLTEPVDTQDNVVKAFFETMQSQQGDALGSTFSGHFEVVFNALTYSSTCETDFIQTLGFYTSGDAVTTAVEVTQTEGVLVWDNLSSLGTDFVGAVFADGSFELFDGDYVDEQNYTYELYQGYFSDDSHFTGTLLATIVMDGKSLQSGLTGSCTVTTTFSGEFLYE